MNTAQHQEHDGHQSHHAKMVADFRRRFWISLIVTLPVLLLAPIIQEFLGIQDALSFPGDQYVLFALSSFIFFYGGWPFLTGLYDELTSQEPGMMTLVAVAITVAYAYSSVVVFGLSGRTFFWELATLVDVMLLGHWIEMRSVMSASRALEELAELMPSTAHRELPDGSLEDVSVSELEAGDRVVVKPGEKIPADGIIVEGESSVNESMLTGESKPVSKGEKDEVIGGAINGEGALTITVEKTGEDSYLSQAISLVREAQASKSKTQNLADRAAVWLTGIALTTGAITFASWFFLIEQDFVFALERSVTVMVITCPHALGLAIPLVVAVSTAMSARRGLLTRNRTAFERARNIDAIIFDKTGTLTKGEFGVTDTVVLGEDTDRLDEETLLQYAAAVESHSEHPIARGIVEAVAEDAALDDALMEVDDFQAIPGKGAEGRVQGKHVKIVSQGYLREQEISLADAAEERLAPLWEQGKTVVFVLIEDQLQGAIALADIIRPESKEAIARLEEMGVRSMMLTGDQQAVAAWVAEELGLDEYFAEVLPHEKAEKVKEVQGRDLIVAMTGDGVNDAPALAQADVGFAIGAGTDVAVETADIILVRSNPLDVVAVFALSRATYRKMIQNLAWATGYNVIAIPLAAGVLYNAGIVLSPAVGALLMSLSTVIVAVNARFLNVEEKAEVEAEVEAEETGAMEKGNQENET
ncbi:MAG: copper-translocating P-type ATPase [Anaerolineales bacterium]